MPNLGLSNEEEKLIIENSDSKHLFNALFVGLWDAVYFQVTYNNYYLLYILIK